jgi:hypothetical protein
MLLFNCLGVISARLPVAAQSLTGFLQGLSLQVPEPEMMLLFGLGVGALGLRLGSKRKD